MKISTYTFSCEFCSRIFKQFSDKDRHIKRIHNNKEESKAKVKCSECNNWLSSRYNLDIHYRTRHRNQCKDSKCIMCNKNSPNNVSKMHENYKCDVCNKSFRLPCILKLHCNTIHNRKTNYHCNICNKDFPTEVHANMHSKVHEDHKFECLICIDKTFARKMELNLHVQTVHLGQRKYRCNECDRSFGTNYGMNSHIRQIHMNKRNYNCKICEKAFKSQANLESHILTVHKALHKFECETCKKIFTSKYNLIIHKKGVHDTLNNFMCNFCDKVFKTKHGLARHVRTSHEVT